MCNHWITCLEGIISLSLITTQWVKNNHFPHFAEEETDTLNLHMD